MLSSRHVCSRLSIHDDFNVFQNCIYLEPHKTLHSKQITAPAKCNICHDGLIQLIHWSSLHINDYLWELLEIWFPALIRGRTAHIGGTGSNSKTPFCDLQVCLSVCQTNADTHKYTFLILNNSHMPKRSIHSVAAVL